MIVRNAIEYDYCLDAAIRSLLFCDQVCIVDGSSDDGTYALLNEFRHRAGVHIVHAEWKPSPNGTWLADLTNLARINLDTEMHISLQADEVLFENDYDKIREVANTGGVFALERLNFWLDHRHILPPDTKVGSTIVRLAPIYVPSVGDAQGLEHKNGWVKSDARIAHYGFIRNPKAFAAKSKPMQQAFFNTYDPIIDEVEKRGIEALGDKSFPTAVSRNELIPYNGPHPTAAHKWLIKNGYQP